MEYGRKRLQQHRTDSCSMQTRPASSRTVTCRLSTLSADVLGCILQALPLFAWMRGRLACRMLNAAIDRSQELQAVQRHALRHCVLRAGFGMRIDVNRAVSHYMGSWADMCSWPTLPCAPLWNQRSRVKWQAHISDAAEEMQNELKTELQGWVAMVFTVSDRSVIMQQSLTQLRERCYHQLGYPPRGSSEYCELRPVHKFFKRLIHDELDRIDSQESYEH